VGVVSSFVFFVLSGGWRALLAWWSGMEGDVWARVFGGGRVASWRCKGLLIRETPALEATVLR
jgi:hypothetical protein